MRFFRFLCFSSLALALTVAVGQTRPISFVPLAKEIPQEMRASLSLGQKSPTDLLHLSVSLKLQDAPGLQNFVDEVSDPNSPVYRQFISPDEVGARFGLPLSHVQAVVNYLTSQGMSIQLVSKNRLTILADATVAQAEKAFNTSIEVFDTTGIAGVATQTLYSFTTPPEAPSGIADDIENISGLDNYGRPQAQTSLSPSALRTLYAVSPIYDAASQGQGRTIGISNFDGFDPANVTTECSKYSLPTPSAGAGTNIKIITISGGSRTGTAQGEGDLDLQAVLAIAPLANVIIYDGSTLDTIGVLTRESNDNAADVITESYSWKIDHPTTLAAHNLHLSMNAQGITYMAASGDHGTDFQGYIYPAIDPEVLIVGGTSVSLDTYDHRYMEVGWNNLGSSGGGWIPTTDAFNTHPAYQVGTGVPSATKVRYRLLPDVALDADPGTGYNVYRNATWHVSGGTSGATPTFAASLADSEQRLITLGSLAADSHGHRRMGRIQDLLYSYNGDSNVFFDVKSGTNGTLPDGTTSKAAAGWDTVTGWGPVVFAGLVAKISKVNSVASVEVSPYEFEGGSSPSVVGSVVLSLPAPTGGTVVNLKASNPAISVPASVTIGAGHTSAQFNVSSVTVSVQTRSMVSASLGDATQTTWTTIWSPYIANFSLSATTVVGGSGSVTATLTLDKAAPSGGVPVTIESSASSAAIVPSMVIVPAGKTSTTFKIATVGVAATTTVRLAALAGNKVLLTSFVVNPASLSSVTLSASSAYAGTVLNGTVTLDGTAPTGGAVINLSSSSSTAVTLSAASITIPAGQSTGVFSVSAKPVDASTPVIISAVFGTGAKYAKFNVLPAIISTLGTSSSSAVGGLDNPKITVTLNSPAGPSGTIVSLTTNATLAARFSPSTVTVASGKTTATTTLTTYPVTSDKAVTLTATMGTSSATTSVSVKAATLKSFSLSSSSIKGGTGSLTGTVSLTGPAATGGAKVTLTSSNPTIVPISASVIITAGSSTATFTVVPKSVTANTSVTVTASYGGTSKTFLLTVTP